VYFCIRDDDTSYFTSPDELERAYGQVTKYGPVSLAIIPFCRAGTSRGIPKAYRERWSIHPLDENTALVQYLRHGIANGQYEAMLHGYHHDEPDTKREFLGGSDLRRKVREGKRYLEDLLHTTIRVFVPPHNAIGRSGLEAITREGLHLGGVAGMRQGWSWLAPASVRTWWRLRRRRANGRAGIPWVLELADHKELAGNPVTPTSKLKQSLRWFDEANGVDGVFCAATHYWELDQPTEDPDSRTVGDHLQKLIQLALADQRIRWVTVGTALDGDASLRQRG
jgi:peptidoglycan/xylan/chitin deacetylase (PgdA/CDA1 family)